jgi:uncharacterized repeat protein (TIGR01451 family)
LCCAGSLRAASNPNGPLRIDVIAAPNFVVDSNAGTPASQSPRSAFIGARFYNDGDTDLTNLVVSIGNYTNGINPTPGLFPRRAHPGLNGPLPGDQFALAHEGGSAGLSDAVRKLGTLEPGQSLTVYWLVSYPILDDDRKPVWGSGPNPADDLYLYYDIWGTAQESGTNLTAKQTSKATMRNEISAMANKIFPNTANQVPQQYQDMLQQYAPTWTNIPADGSVGTRIVAEGIWYMLGNVGMGYDCVGDLVFDHDAWLQPVGNPDMFDAGAFRLSKTSTMLIVQLKGGGEQVILAEDQLYFKDLPENNSVVGFVRYEFVPLRSGIASQLTPYQEAASGSNNEKFNGDYGAMLGNSMKGSASLVSIAKGVNASNAVAGATLQYSVTFTNMGSQKVGDASISLPLVVQDHVPTGTVYVAGSATNGNTLPAGLSDYTVVYSTNNGVSWQAEEPAAAIQVTDIQWWLSGALDPAAGGRVRFSVQVANPYIHPPLIVNTAGISVGNTPPFATGSTSTFVTGNNRLGDRIFADTGEGGGLLGNGFQEGAEPGLSNILVSLYYDGNTNAVADAADWFIGTAVSSTNGAYLFTNLVDGVYVAVVEAADADLPAGYTLTTSNAFRLALDPGHATTGTVSVLTADFGFAPALGLTKTLTGAGPLYEGYPVSYRIEVTNNLPGDGNGGGLPVAYTAWAGRYNPDQTTTGWQSPTNAEGAPDGAIASDYFDKNPSDTLSLSNFSFGLTAGSISNVSVIVAVRVVQPLKEQNLFDVVLVTSGGAEFFRKSYSGAALMTGFLVLDVSTNRAWQWSDFTSNAVFIHLSGKKDGGGPGGYIGVDAAAFRVSSTMVSASGTPANTLDPVPLKDVFDTRLLQFVSASPSPSTIRTNGTVGTIAWDNLGPLLPGAGRTVTLAFKALEPAANVSLLVTNTASVTNAYFANGKPANQAMSRVITNLQPAGVIGDYIWRDENRNGIQETNEQGIANATVVLRPPANVDLGAGAGVALTNTTDRNGYYLFEGIIQTGRYTVAVLTNSLPRGATNTWSEMSGTVNPTNVTVVTNLFPASITGLDVHRTADFGYSWTGATIEGTVWNDLNRSSTAVRDGGEPGFTNVTVYLYAATNLSSAIGTNRTDATGYFRFTGSYSGSYVVVTSTNTGNLGGSTWERTFDTDGLGTPDEVTLSVLPGGRGYADFSYFQTGPYAIGDTLFHDWNGNGVQNTNDEGIAAIPVALYLDRNGNGVVDAGTDVLLAVTNTDAAGYYLFPNRPAGTYLVEVRQWDANFPALTVCTADPYGAKDGLSRVVLSNASDLAQDFGYKPYGYGSIGDTVWRDLNADGVQSGAQETGISNVTVRLYGDLNGDGIYESLVVTNTSASGTYLFSNLPDGAFRVSVDTASSALPLDSFEQRYVPTTATNYFVTVAGAAFLGADFGFTALGAIGDTIFWDNNASGSQDWTEPGIEGVTVNLYYDGGVVGLYEPGTDTLAGSRVTDTNGQYIFMALESGTYIVEVATNGVLTNATLTAAPALDGAPLTNAALQAFYSRYPVEVRTGTKFLGADFGFRSPGALGKMVWLDMNANGLREDGERGIPNALLVLSNATGVVTNPTDPDGYYSFSGVADGTYTLRVLTNAAGFPAGLNPTYDPDGTNNASLIELIVIAGGDVISVGGVARTNFNMMLDFGYRYSGNNSLSGTVGLDGIPRDGRLGTGISGVSADEVPFGGRTVELSVWSDANSDSVVDAGETVFLASTQTATNGDYSFDGLPTSVGSGTAYYIVSLQAPLLHLLLTTTNGSTPALWITPTLNNAGEADSAYQVAAVSASVTNIDFAFRSLRDYDFGDLPLSYSTTLADNPEGARHRVPLAPDLFLGVSLNTENNGKPSPTASLDEYDDGVEPLGVWREAAAGASVRVQVGAGSGWLAGYIDFNANGSFADAGELVVSQAVSNVGGDGSGLYALPVNVPSGAILTGTNTLLNARFRLFPAEPVMAPLAYSGSSDGGEVEDYQWDLGAVGDRVWVDANTNGVHDLGEAPLAGLRVFADLNSNGVWSAEEPNAVTDSEGMYGIGGLPAGSYRIVVDTSALPDGLLAVYDADGGNDSRSQALLDEGETDLGQDFGYAYPGAGVHIVKTAGGAADDTILYSPSGSDVVYRYHVVNAGASYLINLAVEDDVLGAVGTVAGPLAPGAAFDLYATNLNVTAPVVNIGTVEATPSLADGTPIPSLGNVTDSDDAEVRLATEIRGVVWKENIGIIDGIRTNDLFFPEVAVTLFEGGTNGIRAGDTRTDNAGAFSFTNVTTGVAYTVLFTVPKTNNLFRYFANTSDYVLADGPDRSYIGNDARFEALDTNDVFGTAAIGSTQIVFGAITYVDAGLGTNDFSHPLSTAIDLRLIEAANGLFVELCTVDEVVDGEPITLYLRLADGTLRQVGQVLSRGGSQRYLIPVAREALGPEPFAFVVRDESGATHTLPQVTLEAFRAGLVRMDKLGLTLTWASLPGRIYDVYRCARLGDPWKKVVANVLAEGDSCSAIVPTAGEKQAFFKIVMQDR